MTGRRFGGPALPAAVSVIGLAAIVLGQSVPNRHSIEDDLMGRSVQALQEAGVTGVEVSFTGRDGTLRARNRADGDRALAIVRAQVGVRVANVVVDTAAPGATTGAGPTSGAAASPTQPAPSATVAVDRTPPPEQVQTELAGLVDVRFENDSATLTGEGQATVARVADVLKANPTVRISIEGHTDTNGPEQRNLDLSRARAETVRNTLIGLGIAADRLTATGFGESRPKIGGNSAEARAADRRVEFVIQ
jgi:outer membrane protein OmpA-like peptidoglycan-associated protein